jgi:hypothetical protein
MQFATDVYFTSPTTERANGVRASRTADGVVPGAATVQPLDPRSSANQLNDLRICANDISIGVSGGSFTNDPTRTHQSDCQIQSVASLTDDKLMELYVRRGVVPPPPPMGSGQIQVGAQSTPPPSGGSGGAGTSPSQGNSAQAPARAAQPDEAGR